MIFQYHEFETRDGMAMAYAHLWFDGQEYQWASEFPLSQMTPKRSWLCKEVALRAMARRIKVLGEEVC